MINRPLVTHLGTAAGFKRDWGIVFATLTRSWRGGDEKPDDTATHGRPHTPTLTVLLTPGV